MGLSGEVESYAEIIDPWYSFRLIDGDQEIRNANLAP